MSDRLEVSAGEISEMIRHKPHDKALPLVFGPDVVWLSQDKAPWAVEIVNSMRAKPLVLKELGL